MSVELFPGIATDEIKSIPDDGTHLFVLKSYNIGEAAWDGKTYLRFNYQLQDDTSPLNGFKYTKRFWLPNADTAGDDDAKVVKAVNDTRAWLKGHGVEEDEIDKPDLDSLTGMQVLIYGRGYDGQNGRMWGGNNAKRAD